MRSVLALVAALLLAASPALAAPAASDSAPPTLAPVEDYGRLPAMEMVRLSPSGDHYAYVGEVDSRRRLFIATTDNQILEAQDLGAAKIRDLEWAGDDRLLITTSATVGLGTGFTVSKDELFAVTVINLITKKAIGVFQTGNGGRVAKTVAGRYGVAQINGRWYGFFGGYTYDQETGLKTDDGSYYADLYRVDLDTGAFVVAATGSGSTVDWLIGPDGAVLARSLYDEDRGTWRIEGGKSGGVVLASGAHPFGGASLLGFGQTAAAALVEVPGADGTVDEEIPLQGGSPREIADNAKVAGPLIDPITRLWVGVEFNNDQQDASLFDPAKSAHLQSAYKAFPGYITHLVSFSADFSHLIVLTEGGDDSGTYWIVNFDHGHGKAFPLGETYPKVTPAFVGPVTMIDYKAADGMALRGVLTLPPGRGPKGLPVVVMPHGGPAARDYPGFDYWAQAFAARGYAVFQPNFRGSSGYGEAFLSAGFGQWGRKMQTDVSDGLAELVREGVVDPKRACIVGASYGGYAALAGVTLQHGLYRCAVSVAGVSDLADMLDYERDRAGDKTSTTRYWKKFIGVTSDWTDSQARKISPARFAASSDAPILLIHGDNDTTVLIDQSRTMQRALQAAGKPVELVILPGADHWLLEEDARVAMVKASVAFVLKNNPPDPAPAIQTAAQ